MTFTEQINQLNESYAEIAVKKPEAIALLNSVYKTLFGEHVKKSCGNCNVKAFYRIQKEVSLQSQQENFNLENMKKFKDRAFVLNNVTLQTPDFGDLSNENMTDEKAVEVLTKFPGLLKHFVTYPRNEAGEVELDLSKVELDNLDKRNFDDAEESNSVELPGKNGRVDSYKSAKTPVGSKPKAVKTEGPRLPNDGESIKDAAARYGVSPITIEREMIKANIDVKAYKALFSETGAVLNPVKPEVNSEDSAPVTVEIGADTGSIEVAENLQQVEGKSAMTGSVEDVNKPVDSEPAQDDEGTIA